MNLGQKMELKPSSLLTSLVSVLGVLFPGAIVTFLALRGIQNSQLPAALVHVQEGSVEGWTLFIVTSYLAGQLLYALGSWFLDPVYDRTYRAYKTRLKDDPKRLVFPLIRREYPVGVVPPSTYSWARAFIVTRSPSSLAELEQLEADFKFFRGLTLALLMGPFEATTIGALSLAVAILSLLLVLGGAGLKIWSDLHSTTRPPNPTRADSMLDNSLRLLVGGLLLLLAVATYQVWTKAGFIASTAYVVAVAIVMLRFCQQRWQRNETTYEYASAVAVSTGAKMDRSADKPASSEDLPD
jgi:hypothetical protein